MSHRQFIDPHGTLWTVWDVYPSRVERDLDVVRASRGDSVPDSRRSRSTLRLDGAYAAGWLCFESGLGKRRLAPIPSRWESLSADQLAVLCDSAAGVAPTGRVESVTAIAATSAPPAA
ncbi:MAG TPA: hypothetical protein VEA99_04065 [Gemmatimonadaceae bacterium]|nr:hypothetical protein [Gemmatimonadaceae bacterium]